MNIRACLAEMTFEEKTELLTGVWALTTKAIERFGIPSISLSDGPHGIRRLIGHPKFPQECNIPGGDVCFPTASALGASWSTEIAFLTGQAIARDCRQEGVDILLAPGVNMKRTPRCGRNFEYFSEDPVLSGVLAGAFIEGVQSEGVGTSLKHFAANNQETDRRIINAEIDERTLREFYLRVFEIALECSNPVSVMCAYNKVNAVSCSENPYLLRKVLRDDWGYDGLVISDWGAVHNMAKSLAAGMDLQMPQNKEIVSELRDGLDKGIISMDDIDRAAENVLRMIQWIEGNKKDEQDYDRNEQHVIAERAALESITLLKNEEHTLPITSEKYKRIAIFGSYAEMPLFQGGGSSRVTVSPESVDSPLECIRNYAGTEIEVIYEPLFDRIHTYKDKVDAVLLFIGDNYGADAETESMDRQNLFFQNYVNAAIETACNICEKTVVVMQTGALCIPFRWHERAKAIIQMWYAGEAGGSAIAKLLFGLENPCGKLSETFILKPRTDLEYPGDGKKVWYREGQFVGYRYYDRHPDEVWFPFGHGLSYTEFAYSGLTITPDVSDVSDEAVTVRFKVKNTGDRTGKEIVQLYIGFIGSAVVRPEKELRRFEKISLQPGQEQEVEFMLNQRDFAYYNTSLGGWCVQSGEYAVLVGASSMDIRLKGCCQIGEQPDSIKMIKAQI